jgi:hypothetical protein
MGGIQPEHERSAGPVRANPAEQVGAARQRTDHRWRTRRRWVGGVNAVGRGGDPGVPGVRQGGGTGDPGSGERWRQRGTMGAPRQEGAQDPAGQGAAPVTRQAREEGLDLLLQQPFRGRAGHSILRVSRSFHDHDTDGSARAFGGTETVDNLPANPPPFNPRGEKGESGHPDAPSPLIPPAPFSHEGRRGSLGILMPKTREGTQGLPKDPGRGWGLGRALPPQPRAARNRVGARHRAPVQRSAAAGHRCNPAPQAKRVSPRRGAASLQSCAAATTRRSRPSRAQRGIVLGRGIVRPYSAQRQRGIAAILRRRRSGSPLVGARHRAPVQRSAAAGHRCNPAPQAKRVSPRRGAACRSRPLLCRSGASLQSCTAATTRRSRPSRAQRGVVLHVLWSFR